MWCKRGEMLVAWRCVVQGHHLKLLWPYVRTCLHANWQLCAASIFQPERGEKKKLMTGDAWGSSSVWSRDAQPPCKAITATLACIVLAFALGDRLVVDKPPSVDEVRPKVVIRGEEFFVPEHYPKDASGRLEYDKNLIKELEEKTTGVIRNMCKHNPPSAQPTYKDKKSDLIYKRVFCDFI